jgi:hypothetical protein
VSGDFKANHGMWELEPRTRRAHAAALPRLPRPAGLCPELAGALDFKRELPQMLTDLRAL